MGQEIWLESCDWCVQHRCTGDGMVAQIKERMQALNLTLGDEDCGLDKEPRCDGAVFSHPIGDFMHSAGPYIQSSPAGTVHSGRHSPLRRRTIVSPARPA